LLEERREGLERCLQLCVSNEQLRLSSPFRDFVGLGLGRERGREGGREGGEGRCLSLGEGGDWFLRKDIWVEPEEGRQESERERKGLVSFPYMMQISASGKGGGGRGGRGGGRADWGEGGEGEGGRGRVLGRGGRGGREEVWKKVKVVQTPPRVRREEEGARKGGEMVVHRQSLLGHSSCAVS